MPLMHAAAIEDFLDDVFPQRLGTIEAVGERWATMGLAIEDEHLGPGGSVSGHAMMALADVCLYVAILGEIGPEPLAVISDLNIHFLRRARSDRDLMATARIRKLGRRLVVGEIELFSHGDTDPVAIVAATYALPERDD